MTVCADARGTSRSENDRRPIRQEPLVRWIQQGSGVLNVCENLGTSVAQSQSDLWVRNSTRRYTNWTMPLLAPAIERQSKNAIGVRG